MRNVVGDKGILARDLPTLCCRYVIPAGTPIKIDRQHSPKRVWVLFEIEAVRLGKQGTLASMDTPYLGDDGKWMPDPRIPWPAAHKFRHSGDNLRIFEPPFFAMHKVKASKVWFKEAMPRHLPGVPRLTNA